MERNNDRLLEEIEVRFDRRMVDNLYRVLFFDVNFRIRFGINMGIFVFGIRRVFLEVVVFFY